MDKDRYQTRAGVFHDKTGLVYGNLTVIKRDTTYSDSVKWECRCNCGNVVSVHAGNLQKGLTTSCGCYHKEACRNRLRTHGMTGSKEYAVWASMLSRCHNPNSQMYHYYGGNGIIVCDRWRNSFENFYADMGPSNGLTLDRIDPNGIYEPSNCRWASWIVQANNKTTTKMVNYKGETMPLKTFVAMFDIPYQTVLNRLNSGMSPEEAVSKRFLQKL